MIQAILLAVDTSPSAAVAVSYAYFLCGKLGATLDAIYVIDSRLFEVSYRADYGPGGLPRATLLDERGYGKDLPEGSRDYSSAIELSERKREQLEREGKSLLNFIKHEAEQVGLSCHIAVRTGIPDGQIVDAAQGCDLIVMGRHGESTKLEARKRLGAVAERVLRTAAQPVLVAGSRFEEIKRVLLGYDGSERAREAMVYAAELAQRLALPMLALSVHRDETIAHERLETVRRYAEAHHLSVITEARHGDPADAILSAAQDGDLIAMGAFGEGRIREWLLGSTTETVLRAAQGPVLLHR